MWQFILKTRKVLLVWWIFLCHNDDEISRITWSLGDTRGLAPGLWFFVYCRCIIHVKITMEDAFTNPSSLQLLFLFLFNFPPCRLYEPFDLNNPFCNALSHSLCFWHFNTHSIVDPNIDKFPLGHILGGVGNDHSPKVIGNFGWRVRSTLFSPVWRVGTWKRLPR